MNAATTVTVTFNTSSDTTPPTNGSLSATGSSGQVSLSWSGFSDSGGIASYKLVYATGSAPSSCSVGTQVYSGSGTSYTHTGLSNGTTYYYRVCATDNAGNTSSGATNSATTSIVVSDTTAPTGSITISSGATYTTSTSVTLTLSASDASGVSQMCISNSTSCSSWETYTTSKSWTLSSGDGTKTVYIWFKDSVANTNSSPYSDSITLDSSLPSGTFTATGGSAQVSLSWSISDSTSGISNYTLVYATGSTPSSCSSGTQIYSGTGTSYTHTGLTGGTTYYYRVCATDNAGNSTSATNSATPTTTTTACQSETESNDSSSSSNSKSLKSCSGSGTISSSSDKDWWTVSTVAGNANVTLSSGTAIQVNFTISGNCDYILELYGPSSTNSSQHWLAGLNTGGAGQGEQISYTTTASGYFDVLVYGYSSSSGCSYTLTQTSP